MPFQRWAIFVMPAYWELTGSLQKLTVFQ